MTVPPYTRPQQRHTGLLPLAPGDRARVSVVTRILWADDETMDAFAGDRNAAVVLQRAKNGELVTVLLIRQGLSGPVSRAAVKEVRAELHQLGVAKVTAWAVVMADGVRRAGFGYLRLRAASGAHEARSMVFQHAREVAVATAAVLTVGGGAWVAATHAGSPAGQLPHSPAWYAHHPVHVVLPGRPLSYLGAFEQDSPYRYSGPGQTMETFAAACGRQPNLALYYSGWQERFQAGFAAEAADHGAIPLVQINPELDPGHVPISLAAIAGGTYDSYLTLFADEVNAYGRAVVIGFGHEMNGSWYPWGWGRQAAREFVAAWRHVVTVFRRQGADNVTWMWTANAVGPKTGPLSYYWPGSSYVTWVAVDGYYRRLDDTWSSVFAPTITQIRRLSSAPLLVGETAVGPLANESWQIGDMYASIRQHNYLGLVWFDENVRSGHYRLEGNTAADAADITAFRQQTAAWRLIHQRVAKRGHVGA